MYSNLLKYFLGMFIFFTPLSHALPLDALQCNKTDAEAIDNASRIYFEEHSALFARDLFVSSQLCENDSASAKISVGKGSDIEAIVYLKKINNTWQVQLLGSASAFTENALSAYPTELREATQTLAENNSDPSDDETHA